MPEQYQQQYEDLLSKHHDVFSKSNIDIGKAEHFEHDINRKDEPLDTENNSLFQRLINKMWKLKSMNG